MTPQQKQAPRKVTVDLGSLTDNFKAYASEHFAGDKSWCLRYAVLRMLRTKPAKTTTIEAKGRMGRPPKDEGSV